MSDVICNKFSNGLGTIKTNENSYISVAIIIRVTIMIMIFLYRCISAKAEEKDYVHG